MRLSGSGVLASMVAACLFCAAAAAAPSSDPPQSAPGNPDYARAAVLIEGEKFAEALPLLKKPRRRSPTTRMCTTISATRIAS